MKRSRNFTSSSTRWSLTSALTASAVSVPDRIAPECGPLYGSRPSQNQHEEVCDILCPCWVGEDPDNGTCDGLLGWNITKGSINGTNVVGHSIVALAHIPGNILKGNWKVRMYIDDKTSATQKDAMLNVWSGKLGGPIADMAKLIGEV